MLSLSSHSAPSAQRSIVLVVPNDAPVQLPPELLAELERDGQVQLLAMPSAQISAALGNLPNPGDMLLPVADFSRPQKPKVHVGMPLFGTSADEARGMNRRDARRMKRELAVIVLILLALIVVCSSTGCTSGFTYETTLSTRVSYQSKIVDQKSISLKLPPAANKLLPESVKP